MSNITTTIQKTLILTNLAVTKRECKEFIDERIIHVNDKVANHDTVISEADFIDGKLTLWRGKRERRILTIQQWLNWQA